MDIRGMASAAVLLVLQLYLSDVYCDSHTLMYHITMTNAAAPALHQYSVTGYMNGLPIGRYNSEIRHAQFLIPSMNRFTDHLEKLTKYAQQWEVQQTRKMNFLMNFLNKTDAGKGDLHVYQRKFSCELHKDGSLGGYQEIAFDGKEIITFDKEREVFVPATQEAVIMVQQWNMYQGNAKENRLYMENECIHQMKMYMGYVTTKLEKKVQPNVKISSSESDHSITIHCHVYGFYPRDVEVKWIKNGRDKIDSEEAPEILPNPDGTYQIRVSVEVTPEEGATYSCHVDHSSLENEIVGDFKTKHRSAFYILISVTALGLFLAGLGIFIYKRCKGRKDSRQTVSTVEEDFKSEYIVDVSVFGDKS